MTRLETQFLAADSLSPDFAAKLSKHAERFDADISLICGEREVRLDSLISILSMEFYHGVKVIVVADGSDEAAAAEELRKILEGKL